MDAETKHKAYTVLGQALSSLSNFVPGIFAAHVLSPRQFGIFGLIQLAYVLSLGVLRSSFTEVAMLAEATDEPTERHFGSIDAVLGVSFVLAAASVLAVLVFTETAPAAVVLTGLGMVVALTQDAVRLVSTSVGDGVAMAVNDGLWLLTLIGTLVLVDAFLDVSPWIIAASWTLAAAPGLLYGLVNIGWRPRGGRVRWFVLDKPAMPWALLSDWSMRTGASQAAIYGLGLVGGLVAVAQIRASQLLLGPLNIGFTGVQLAMTRTILVSRRTSLPSMRRLLRHLSLGLGCACLLAGGSIFLAPEPWLAAVVGEQAEGVKIYVLPVAVGMASTGFAVGAVMGLRVLHAGKALARTRLQASATTLMTACAGYVATDSTMGGLWGLAIGGLGAIILWVRGFGAAYRVAVGDDPGVIGQGCRTS